MLTIGVKCAKTFILVNMDLVILYDFIKPFKPYNLHRLNPKAALLIIEGKSYEQRTLIAFSLNILFCSSQNKYNCGPMFPSGQKV